MRLRSPTWRSSAFSVQKIEFADRLRYYRNGILYYGKSFDAAYARKVLRFLEELRKLLHGKGSR